MHTSRTVITLLLVLLSACTFDDFDAGRAESGGETGRVTRVIDGDTIDVVIDGESYRVRYIGINAPERDETCYREAVSANEALVEGETVRLVRDVSNTDQYDRLLRYVYVGERFVNAELIANGWAEAVEYAPDTKETGYFRDLERQARRSKIGCHPTGIFDDGSDRR